MQAHESEFAERRESHTPHPHRRDDNANSHAGEAVARGRTDVLGPTSLMQLQKALGNASVSSLIMEATSPVTDGIRSGGGRSKQQALHMSSETPIQRWIGVSAPIPSPSLQGHSVSSGAVSAADRKRMEAETGAEIVLAFTAFTDACTANITAMKAAAKADAEVNAMLIDIATGFLAPAFASYVASKFLSKVTELSDEVSKNVVTRLISQNDLLKATFSGATKTVSTELKIHATQLFGEKADDALLDGLKIEFQKNAVALSGSLGTMSDEKLVATWVAYDPDAANVTTYKSTINDLLKEFHDIQELGVHKFFGDDALDQNHLLIKVEGLGYAIAIREIGTWLYPDGPYEFYRPIDDYFVDEAIRRAKDVGQKKFPTLKTSEVKGIPDGIKQWGKR